MRLTRSAFAALVLASLIALPALGQSSQPKAPAQFDPYAGASPESKKALASATAFEEAGKWKSAYDLLTAYDSAGADPYVLALRTEICLKGFVQTKMHQAFSLVDLEEGQILEEIRSGNGEFQLFEFDPAAAAEAVIASGKAKAPAVLSAALGDYYYEVQNLFSGQWLMSDEEACAKSVSYYEAAEAQGMRGAEGVAKRGELLVKLGRFDDAEAALRAALDLDASSAAAHLNLAVVLAQKPDNLNEALAEVDAGLKFCKGVEQRFNAYIVGARLAAEADPARCEAYIAAAEKEFPEEPGPSLVRQMIAVQLGKADAAASAADMAFDRFSDSPYVVRNILTNWLEASDLQSATAFLDRNLARMGGHDASLGILYFYKALLMAQAEGPSSFPAALELLGQAETSFVKVYAPGDQVFEAISELKAQLSAAPAAEGAESSN